MRTYILVMTVLGMTACSGASSSNDAGTDGGSLDARTAIDAGETADATVDSAVAPDAFVETDAGTTTDAGPSTTACPTDPPESGSTCTPEGLACSYGDDPRVSCRARAECSSGSWMLTEARCTEPPLCPDPEPGDAITCSDHGAVCGYGTDACTCYACTIPCSNPNTWHCGALAEGCPPSPPNLGTACSVADVFCNYGSCVGSWAVQCTDGAWQQRFTPCAGGG